MGPGGGRSQVCPETLSSGDIKLKALDPASTWQYRVRGGAKNNIEDQKSSQPLLNPEEGTLQMVDRAISCAKSHGINVDRGAVNLTAGNCAFETAIHNINARTCFQETFNGEPDHWRKVWMTEVEKIAYDGFNVGFSRAEWKEGWEILKQSGKSS